MRRAALLLLFLLLPPPALGANGDIASGLTEALVVGAKRVVAFGASMTLSLGV